MLFNFVHFYDNQFCFCSTPVCKSNFTLFKSKSKSDTANISYHSYSFSAASVTNRQVLWAGHLEDGCVQEVASPSVVLLCSWWLNLKTKNVKKNTLAFLNHNLVTLLKSRNTPAKFFSPPRCSGTSSPRRTAKVRTCLGRKGRGRADRGEVRWCPGGQCYKTFFFRKLRMFAVSSSVCSRQAFPT